MKKYFVNMLVAAAAILMVLSFAGDANAQRRRESRNRLMTKAQVKQVISRVEDRVDNFVKNNNKSLDKSKLDGSSREDWLNKRARDLESATDELSREFEKRDALTRGFGKELLSCGIPLGPLTSGSPPKKQIPISSRRDRISAFDCRPQRR